MLKIYIPILGHWQWTASDQPFLHAFASETWQLSLSNRAQEERLRNPNPSLIYHPPCELGRLTLVSNFYLLERSHWLLEYSPGTRILLHAIDVITTMKLTTAAVQESNRQVNSHGESKVLGVNSQGGSKLSGVTSWGGGGKRSGVNSQGGSKQSAAQSQCSWAR